MQKQKRILMLGGSYFQVPAIKYAKDSGCYVITCDYLPENPGHKYADEYYNISTTDLKGVLELAINLKIDGVVAYASDPAAPTAAYVSEVLNLPGNPFRSVKILTEKDLFRKFLLDNDFNVPMAKGYSAFEDVLNNIDNFTFPVMVKPVDSSGSKGVSKISNVSMLKNAYNYALSFSRSNKIIIEEFVNRKGAQIGGDGFVINGDLIFCCLGDQQNNPKCNPFVPDGMFFPSSIDVKNRIRIVNELERALKLLGFRQGAINIEIMLDKYENIYLMEIGPRSGGNCIPETIKYATGFDAVKASVEVALGNFNIIKTNENKVGYYSYYALHSCISGLYNDIVVSDALNSNILEKHIFKKKGDIVEAFNGSNATIGILLLKFSSRKEMQDKMANIHNYVNINVECKK